MGFGLVEGSIKDVATSRGARIEEVIMDASLLVVMDQSGSMWAGDARGGRSRYDVADEELEKLQRDHPGQIVLVCFSDNYTVCLDGIPNRSGGGTNMARVLDYLYSEGIDGLLDIVVVSDGEPDDEDDTLRAAQQFSQPIHTIFIGPENGSGQRFMKELARRTGGKPFVSPKPGELGAGVVALLEERHETHETTG